MCYLEILATEVDPCIESIAVIRYKESTIII